MKILLENFLLEKIPDLAIKKLNSVIQITNAVIIRSFWVSYIKIHNELTS